MDDKTKQVQVRLTPDRHRQLKGKLALDDRKLVEFFNEAALAYLNDPKRYNEMITKILEDTNNG